MIERGDRFNCAICTSGVVEILLDANQDTLDLMNEQFGDTPPAFLCNDCADHIAGKSDHRRLIVWTGQAQ